MGKQALALLTDAELKAPITKRNFFPRATNFIKTNMRGMPLFTIRQGCPEWLEWRQYFERHLDWVPHVMRMMIDRAPGAPEAMTVPTQWPQHFDSAFVCDPDWRYPMPRLVTKKEHRETLKELEQRFGPDWGIKLMKETAKKRVTWTPPTDDDLRKLYGKRHNDAGRID